MHLVEEKSIRIDKVILLRSLLKILSILLIGMKPPEEIIVNEKFNASKVLKFIIFKITKINIVVIE